MESSRCLEYEQCRVEPIFRQMNQAADEVSTSILKNIATRNKLSYNTQSGIRREASAESLKSI